VETREVKVNAAMNKKTDYILLFVLFCLIGAGLEWGYGAFWSLVGVTPWAYPNSPVHFTSLEMIPLWGFAGLICILLYQVIFERKAKFLLSLIPLLILPALWILIYARFIA